MGGAWTTGKKVQFPACTGFIVVVVVSFNLEGSIFFYLVYTR